MGLPVPASKRASLTSAMWCHAPSQTGKEPAAYPAMLDSPTAKTSPKPVAPVNDWPGAAN